MIQRQVPDVPSPGADTLTDPGVILLLRSRGGRCPACPAFTLTELVVVIGLLGLIASAVFPTTAYVLARARERDAQARLVDSWKLARAMAMASGEPVWWQVRQAEGGVEVTLTTVSQDSVSKTILLRGWSVARSNEPDAGQEGPAAKVLVAPHGLTEDFILNLSREGAPAVRITLPGVIDEDSHATAHGAPLVASDVPD